jgi:predicted Rossmann-fold nucleotide-binding protein
MVTWKQLGIHGKPVVIANIGGYFDPLLQQLEKAIRLGYARAENRILYGIADTTKAILTFLEGAPVLERKPGNWA